MKFSCERCQTRYSIGDEKVRGKVLKIRCKTCGNIVVVREQTATSAALGAGMPELVAAAATGKTVTAPAAVSTTPAAPRGDVDWYVAIKGKQHGPAKKDDIARLFREGKITDRSYLWNEGMAAWTRLREVPQFAFLLSGDTAPRRPPPPPPPSEERGEEQQGAEIIPFDEARRARDADPFAAVSARSGVGAITNDPFAAVSQGTGPGGDGAPRDSTRVFIMQAGLHNRGTKHKMYAGIAAACVVVLGTALYADFKGIIEIPGLHSVVNVVTNREPKAAEPVVMAGWDDAEEDPKLKCQLMPNPAECVKQTMVLNDMRRARKKAREAKDPALDNSNFGVAITGAGTNIKGAQVGVGGAADISNQTEAARIAAVFSTDKKKLTVPKARVEPVAVSGSEIDAESVYKTIGQSMGSVKTCIEQGAKMGTVPEGRHILTVSIEPNGLVSKASFRDGPTNASPVGECIRGAARRWKFQAFPGPAADVEVPLILSVGM